MQSHFTVCPLCANVSPLAFLAIHPFVIIYHALSFVYKQCISVSLTELGRE